MCSMYIVGLREYSDTLLGVPAISLAKFGVGGKDCPTTTPKMPAASYGGTLSMQVGETPPFTPEMVEFRQTGQEAAPS